MNSRKHHLQDTNHPTNTVVAWSSMKFGLQLLVAHTVFQLLNLFPIGATFLQSFSVV
jgi:hypothetical protein